MVIKYDKKTGTKTWVIENWYDKVSYIVGCVVMTLTVLYCALLFILTLIYGLVN